MKQKVIKADLVPMTFTKAKLRKFRLAYNRAFKEQRGNRDGVFEFEHHDFLIGYVGYLLEYLDSQMK